MKAERGAIFVSPMFVVRGVAFLCIDLTTLDRGERKSSACLTFYKGFQGNDLSAWASRNTQKNFPSLNLFSTEIKRPQR